MCYLSSSTWSSYFYLSTSTQRWSYFVNVKLGLPGGGWRSLVTMKKPQHKWTRKCTWWRLTSIESTYITPRSATEDSYHREVVVKETKESHSKKPGWKPRWHTNETNGGSSIINTSKPRMPWTRPTCDKHELAPWDIRERLESLSSPSRYHPINSRLR